MASRPTIFFVCGCPKSGTTWVQLMLDRHPEVSCAGESQLVTLLHKFSRLIDDHNRFQRQRNRDIFGEIPRLSPFPEIDREDETWLFEALIARLFDKSVHKPDVRAIGDKTPNVAEQITWFQHRAPSAKFIHVIRDGRDVAVSGWHHLRRTSTGSQTSALDRRVAFRDYALMAAQIWRDTIARCRVAAAAMPGRYHEVRYEDLQERPAAALEAMLRFLGVSTDVELCAACIAESSFATVTGGRAAGQENTGAFLRKGVAGDWHNWFDAELNAAFVSVAGTLLTGLGYQTGADPCAQRTG